MSRASGEALASCLRSNRALRALTVDRAELSEFELSVLFQPGLGGMVLNALGREGGCAAPLEALTLRGVEGGGAARLLRALRGALRLRKLVLCPSDAYRGAPQRRGGRHGRRVGGGGLRGAYGRRYPARAAGRTGAGPLRSKGRRRVVSGALSSSSWIAHSVDALVLLLCPSSTFRGFAAPSLACRRVVAADAELPRRVSAFSAGAKSLAALLRSPECTLKTLSLRGSVITEAGGATRTTHNHA